MESRTWKVYKHTAPNGKVYIGVTHQKPESRWNSGKGYRSNTHFYNAICKYGWDNFGHEIVAEGLTETEAIKMETELIAKNNSANKQYGYNVALGGHNQSEESRKKIGATRKERGIVPPNKGKRWSEETRKKISASLTGRRYHVSDDARENIRNAKIGEKNPHYGKPLTWTVEARLAKVQRAVIQIKEDETVRYDSAKVAQKETGILSCNICRACQGKRKTAGGFKWEYA